MAEAGVSVLSVGHENSGAVVPIVTLDLTTQSGVAILWDILSCPSLMAIHLGLPCGTASLARERPVSEALRRKAHLTLLAVSCISIRCAWAQLLSPGESQ